MIRVTCLVLVLFGFACAEAVTPQIPESGPNEDTTLGAGDVFAVRVFGEEDLSASYQVARDGSIDFPLVGRVNVAGLEPAQVADLLRDGLRDGGFLVRPQVSVMVEQYNSKRVTVMGAVGHAGTFPLSPGLTVVQAISLAGGFSAIANRDHTVVTRVIGGATRRFVVPVDAVSRGRADDVLLRAGDIVFVPERAF